MKKFLLSLLALMTVGMVVMTTADDAQAQDKAFESMLRAVDTVPSRADLDTTWTDAQQQLVAATLDTKRDLWSRSRALSLLSLYPTPEIRAVLVRLTDSPEARLRQTALYTLGRSFGAPGDAELVAFIVAKVADKDDNVRRYAVRTLRWIDHASAGVALEKLAKQSDDPEIAHLARYVLKRRSARLQ